MSLSTISGHDIETRSAILFLFCSLLRVAIMLGSGSFPPGVDGAAAGHGRTERCRTLPVFPMGRISRTFWRRRRVAAPARGLARPVWRPLCAAPGDAGCMAARGAARREAIATPGGMVCGRPRSGASPATCAPRKVERWPCRLLTFSRWYHIEWRSLRRRVRMREKGNSANNPMHPGNTLLRRLPCPPGRAYRARTKRQLASSDPSGVNA